MNNKLKSKNQRDFVTNNRWLKDEEMKILSETNRNKRIARSNMNNVPKMIWVLLLFIFSVVYYDTCQSHILTERGRALCGNTWTCSNPYCGYQNYEGVSHCGICGRKRE